MKYTNINILGVGKYHPENKVDNSYYIEHFNKQNIDINNLLNYLGRKERYISNDETENSISMAFKASQNALEKCNVSPKDIDMLIFISETPEYLAPCNAVKIHNMLGTVNANIVYDMNCNCVGGIVAIDQISRVMQTNNRVKKALIVCSALSSLMGREDDPLIYALSGDLSCALILEKKEEDIKRGFIDSIYHTDSVHHYTAAFPTCGYSNILRGNIKENNETKWTSVQFDFDFICDIWTDMINDLLKSNNAKIDEVGHFLFSQCSKPNIITTLDKLNVDSSDTRKYTFVADEYGYTGATSPIIALERALETKMVKENSTIILCSVGAGYTTSAVLYKF